MIYLVLLSLVFKIVCADENDNESFEKFNNFYLLTSNNDFNYTTSMQACNNSGQQLTSLKEDFLNLLKEFSGTFFAKKMIFREKYNNSFIEGHVFPNQLGMAIFLTERAVTSPQTVCVNKMKEVVGIDNNNFLGCFLIFLCVICLIVIPCLIILKWLNILPPIAQLMSSINRGGSGSATNPIKT